MPAHSSTARTGPPAITPVPGEAGLSRTTPAAFSPCDRVRDGALDTGDLEEVLLGLLNTLGDGGRHLLGLAVTDTHGAVTIAHHDQRGEAEATTTLHNLGDAVDRDNALNVRGLLGGSSAAVTALPVPPLAATGTASAALGSSHWITSLCFR